MNDVLKIYFFVILRSLVFHLQKTIRFFLNGRCYPTKEQRENETFRDYWIGWIAYKYFSKFTVCNNWLTLDFVGPNNDLIFTKNSHGDMMTKRFSEIIEIVKINNNANKITKCKKS
jgi:hypothetical protein